MKGWTMKIDVFERLLRQVKGNQCVAYVPTQAKEWGDCRRGRVAVSYGGKVYEYRGTILSVAEKLSLIPNVDHYADVRMVIAGLQSGISNIIAHSEIYDTVRHEYGIVDGQWIQSRTAGKDDYDRELSEFYLSPIPDWAK